METVVEGLLLGLSTGASCLFQCGPALLPFLLGQAAGVRRSYVYLLRFMAGRLAAYLLLGVVAGAIGGAMPQNLNGAILGVAYCLLAAMMIAYGLHRFRQVCLGQLRRRAEGTLSKRFPAIVPVMGGFLTSVSICPPLLLAVSKGAEGGSVAAGVATFAAFFVGTAVYFLPLPVVALWRKNNILPVIGKYAAIIAGVMFFVKGVAMILL